jgi:hypothetical protein
MYVMGDRSFALLIYGILGTPPDRGAPRSDLSILFNFIEMPASQGQQRRERILVASKEICKPRDRCYDF